MESFPTQKMQQAMISMATVAVRKSAVGGQIGSSISYPRQKKCHQHPESNKGFRRCSDLIEHQRIHMVGYLVYVLNVRSASTRALMPTCTRRSREKNPLCVLSVGSASNTQLISSSNLSFTWNREHDTFFPWDYEHWCPDIKKKEIQV